MSEVPTPAGDARQPPSPEALARFLPQQRWFAGKNRDWELAGTTTVAALGPTVSVELVHVRYADGDVETYQLPLVRYPEAVEALAHVLVEEATAEDGTSTWSYDALHDKEVTRLWTAGVAAGRDDGALTFHRTEGASALDEDATSIVIGAEQSNTSLVFGGDAILKVFRKVSHGLNPDIEIHEALVRAGSEHVAEILGWVEGRWTDADGMTGTGSLAMLQAFLRTATEGWESAKASVRDLYAEGDLHADEVGGDFAGESSRLGEATGEVHRALAEALGTGTLDRDALRALAEGMRERLRRALGEVPGLQEHAGALGAAYDALADLPGGLPVQRVHGDFHLGQTMRTLKGWKLLDFEGEPARPLAERRAMDSPLKDVAGMLRSFDYAARHLLVDRPEPHLEYRANEWATRNRDAFCDGYGQVVGADPREGASAVVLRAFETDKAVYEAVYEARNRPGWLGIPLSAIERLAATGERRS
jgi:maltokinase